MLGVAQTTSQPAARVERPARALLGWMQPHEALLMLTGRRQDVAPTDEQRLLVERLRDGVARRATGIDQSGIEQPATAALTPYLADLEKDQAAAGLIASGCRVALIDLARVIAAQPLVHVDHADERVAAAQLGDIASIARVSLPTTQPVELPATFDQAQKAWVLTSANPNLRLIGAGQGQAPQGPPVLGFSVALVTSFVRIARYRERYILVDGYHRAHGFLRRGITIVPAFVSDVASFEALALPALGMLPQDAFLGDRPPVLADYLNDEVSAQIMVPATHKTIAIVGMEFQAVG